MSALTPLSAKWNAATITFNTLFRETLAGTKVDYEKVASKIPSDTREEDYAWMDRIPAMREWIGQRQVNNVSIRMQTLINKLWEDTVAVKRTDIEDDKIGAYRPVMEELARQAAELPDAQVAAAMQAGTTAVAYDNQHFFDTSHPVNMDNPNIVGPSGSATQANLLTSSSLSASNVQTAIQTMKSWAGADGKPLRIRPTLLVVPPQLEMVANQICTETYLAKDILLSGPAHGAAMDSNPLKGVLQPFVWEHLAGDATSWYVLSTNRAIKPFLWQDRMAPEFIIKNRPDDEGVFEWDEFKYGTRARGVAGYGPWFLALKCTA